MPNPSFETLTFCPSTFGNSTPLPCAPWQDANQGSSDYFHTCSSPDWVGVPVNFFGVEPAHTGEAYAGSVYRSGQIEYREYLQVELISPLGEDTCYYFSMYVSLPEERCGITRIGAYFSVDPPAYFSFLPIILTPQIDANLGYVSETNGWTLVEGYFTAQGGEQYLTIGNFYSNEESPVDPECPHPDFEFSYYFVDDVSLVPTTTESLNLELGDPVTACGSFEIVPGLGDINYLWEDGSQNPILTVTESGTYALTISAACAEAIDSIEITILGNGPPVSLEPIVVLCTGDTYTIELPPDAGVYSWSDGTQGPMVTISNPGLYAVTLDDGCNVSTDEIEVTVISPPPPFSLGSDTVLCPGEELTFDFDPDLGTFEWSDGSSDHLHVLDQPGLYSLSIENMCGMVMDDIEIAVSNPPSVFLGPPVIELCEGDLHTFLLDPDVGNYIWQDGSTQSEYDVTTEGLYAVTVSNRCGDDDTQIFVDVIGRPLPDLGADITVCPSLLPVELDVMNTPHATGYFWQDGTSTPTYTVTQSGTYTVIAYNSCFQTSDSITLTVEPGPPVVQLPGDQWLCPGSSYTITSSYANGTSTWQDGTTADSFVVNGPGVYSLHVTTACGTGSDTMMVYYYDPITPVDLGSDIRLCPGATAVLYTGITDVSHLWSDMSTADSLLVTAAGLYFVLIQDECMTATDTVEVTLSDTPPLLDLGADVMLCHGDSLELMSGIFGVSFAWNNGSTEPTLIVTQPGTYSLFITNACGSDTDTVIVSDGGDTPTVDLGPDIEICPGDHALVSPVSTSVDTWQWSDGSSLPTLAITSSGTYSVQVTNTCGQAFDTVIVSYLPPAPMVDLGPDTVLCPGSSLTFFASASQETITWSDGSTQDSLQITSGGTFWVVVANTCGSGTDTMVVTELPGIPDLDLGPDVSLCPGETITIDPQTSDVNFVWHDGSTQSVYSTMQPGWVVLQISNACGVSVDSMQIIESLEGPTVDLGPDIEACSGDTVVLMASVPGVAYGWSDGSADDTYTVATDETVILTVMNLCGIDTDTVNVGFEVAPAVFSLGPDTMLCPGEAFQLNIPAGAEEWMWQDGTSGMEMTVVDSGVYYLQIQNACGVAADTIIVSLNPHVPVVTLIPQFEWCPGDLISLDAAQSFHAIYNWNTGSVSPVIDVVLPGNYSVTVSTECGDAISQSHVRIHPDCLPPVEIFIPNVFTPNGDGINDAFEVYVTPGAEITHFAGSVYDRWGNVVYEAGGYPMSWDGNAGLIPMMPAVFAYRISMTYMEKGVEKNRIFQGDVTVIR